MATAKKTPAAKTSTAVAVKKDFGVVDMKAAMAADLATLGDRVAPAGGAKIKVKKTGFVTPDGAKNQTLDVVVLDFISANNWYQTPFDEDKIVPVTCYARGTNPLKMVPSDKSRKIQNETCNGCWANEFKSAPNGKGKACSNQRFLAVVPATTDDNEAKEEDQILLLAISPTAAKEWDAMVQSIARIYQTTPVGVIVTLSLDDSVDYAKVSVGNPRPNPDLAMHYSRKQEARDFLMVDPDTTSWEDADAKPAKPVAGRKPAAAGRR